jgi:hypothetical protein
MKPSILAIIDWNRGVWVMQYRDTTGNLITEPTEFPACTPSVVVGDKLLEARPGARVFTKLS